MEHLLRNPKSKQAWDNDDAALRLCVLVECVLAHGSTPLTVSCCLLMSMRCDSCFPSALAFF